MRNLKKVLSLTLALVMMLGMMTFAGAAEAKKLTAADLTDMNDVKNKEAVTLLVDLGIIAGRDTGKFDPKGSLTRAEFAKMIYVSKMGADDKATNFVGAATGLTDTKMWAEGYINYCFSTGIVAGRTATVFDPDGKVKTVEAAKMLLTALGFDAEAQGYVGDSLWSVNVMQDAKKNGLMAGVKDASDAFLTRDSAAQMIFNALFAKTITNERQKDFTGKWYISKTTQNATTLGEETFDLVKVTGTISETGANTIITGAVSVPVLKPSAIAGTYTANGLASATNDLGYKCSFYMTSEKKLISTTVTLQAAGVYQVPVGLDAAGLVTKDGSVKNWLKSQGLDATHTTKFADDAVVNHSATARTPVATGPAYLASFVLAKGVTATAIDTDNNGVIDYLNIFTAEVKTVGDAGVTTKVNASTGKTQVKIASVRDTLTDIDSVVGYEGLKKDDVVTIVYDGDKYIITKSEPMTAQLTSISSDAKYTIGGKKYEVSSVAHSSKSLLDIDNANKDMKVWLDASGYIIKVELLEEAAKTNVAVVVGYLNTVSTSLDPEKAAVVLLYLDGTTERLNVSKYSATLAGTPTTDLAANDDLPLGSFVSYSKNADGTVVLKKITAAATEGTKEYDLGTLTAAHIKNGLVTFAPADASKVQHTMADGTTLADGSINGNANTVFIVKNIASDGTITYSVKTGIANAPAFTDPKVATGTVLILDGMATVVYISEGAPDVATSATEYTYVTSTDYVTYPEVKGVSDAYREFKAIVKGEATTVKTSTSFAFPVVGMYDLTATNGLVTAATFKTPTAQAVEYTGGLVKAGEHYYTTNADSVIYVIEGNTVTEVKAADITKDDNDLVYFVASTTADAALKDTTIGKFYIVRGEFSALDATTTICYDATSPAATDIMDTANTTTATAYAADHEVRIGLKAGTTLVAATVNGTTLTADQKTALTGATGYAVANPDAQKTNELVVTLKVASAEHDDYFLVYSFLFSHT